MNKWMAGASAGFVATVALSAMMLAKSAMGLMPRLDMIGMMSGMMNTGATVAWVVHFMIGTLGYGLVFAALAAKLPGGNYAARGAVLGAVGWLVMMVAVMPMAGAGLFGMDLGIMAPAMTLILHLIFGAVLGWTFARLHDRAPARMVSHAR